MTEKVTTAVLLAAGAGKRLAPLTDKCPKCLSEVNGASILERLIRSLRVHGVRHLVVVVGHFEHALKMNLGIIAKDFVIEYVVNPKYETTNNIYSLWLARELIREPFILLESDVVFDPPMLEAMLVPDRIAVSPIKPWMQGTTVTASRGQVTAFHLGNKPTPSEFEYKTVNFYSLSVASWNIILEQLGQFIKAGKVNDYYEVVFAKLVADGCLNLEIVQFDNTRWYEIDTLEDLIEAERIFSCVDTTSALMKPS